MNRWRLLSLPTMACLLFTLAALPVGVYSQSPAPKAKQLRIGIIGSGDSNFDLPSQGKGGAWRWIADRYGYYAGAQSLAGGLNREEVDSLKRFNPNIKITKYDLHAREAWLVNNYVPSDTMNMIRYAQATGVPLESLLVIANGAVTINNRACPGYTYCGNVTTNTGGIVKYINYATNQARVMFDPRSKRYGYYLAHIFDSMCTALNIDGIFGDEYGAVGYTGIPNCDECTMSTIWPLREANYWVGGWDAFKRPFNVTIGNFYTGRDSLRKWDTLNWFKAMTDSLVKIRGRIYFMNTSANGGSIPGYWNQWTNDIAPMARLAKSTAQGEYTYQYPGDGGYYDNCRVFLRQMVDTRDWAREMGYMWIRLGQYDQSIQGHSLDRSQMTTLGFMLDISVLNKSIINPYGRTDLFFLPCLKNGQTDFYWNYARDINGVVHQDTTSLWSYAWGKFFGDPSGVLDTSQSGTDGASQTYRIDKAVFYKPGTTDTLTLSIGRIGRLTTSYDTSTTGASVTLPGSASVQWYPLRSRNHVVKWDAPITGGSVIKVGNAHFQVFSRDTVLSNSGPADTTISIGDASVTEGGSASVTVAISKLLATNLTFRVSTASGTATSGTDFTAISNQTFTITAGQLSTTIPVATLQDAVVEGTETFTVTISNQSLGTISRAAGTVTILDDDSGPTNDTVPPAKVNDLGCVPGSAPGQLVLTWTAPGGNGNTGKAAGYQIGYAVDSITAATWSTSAVTKLSNLLTPGNAGTSQSFSLSATQGLANGSKYWVGLKAYDSSNNYSVLSNVPSATTKSPIVAGDSVPPSTVSGLTCSPGSDPAQLFLTWIAPGDNGATGTVAGYEVGYSRDTITEATWPTSAVHQVGFLVTPVPAGGSQQLLLTVSNGLIEGTRYWVGVKAFDTAGNYTSLSNVPSATTRVTVSTGGEVCIAAAVSPIAGALVSTLHPTFTVQNTTCATPGPHTYFFEVAPDSTFSQVTAQSPLINEGQQITSWVPSERFGAGQHFWHVRVDNFDFNDVSYFSVKAQTFAYPNPFSLSSAMPVTFTDVPQGANLLITSVAGDLVRRWPSVAGGDITWKGENESGNTVSPGVYLWYVESTSVRGKVVVLR